MHTTPPSLQDKINLIYIASTGRSGSTLLETILGAHSKIVTAGEVHVWPQDLIEGGTLPCGCGNAVPECDFWNRMNQKVQPLQQPNPQIHFFRNHYNSGKTLRWERLTEFWASKSSNKVSGNIAKYGKNNYVFFRSFLDLMKDETGNEFTWVVDSSKDPYRLIWLLKSGFFNIKVLHVVKDPRSFVYSMTKNIIKQYGNRSSAMLLRRTVMKSLSWLVQNKLFSQVAKKYLDSSNYLLIPYEELATSPEATFKSVCRMLDCEFEIEAIKNFRKSSVHTVAGNPMRFREGGIQLDEAWKKHLPPLSKKVTEIIVGPSMSKYGYKQSNE